VKSFSVATVAEKNKVFSDVAFVITLDIKVINPITKLLVEEIHLVRNNEDMNYMGNTYIATPFEIEFGSESGGVPEVSLTIPDYSRAIQARMQAYGGGVGFEVDMMIVNTGNLDQEPENIEWFEVITATASNYSTSWTLGTSNSLLSPFPKRRQYRDRCSWRFKSVECAYSGGASTCDLSLQGPNGCSSKSNEKNFGGFPGLGKGITYG